jgi:hypothetical protein
MGGRSLCMCAQNIIWARASTLNSGCWSVRDYGNRNDNSIDGWHGIFGFSSRRDLHGMNAHMLMLDSGRADRACSLEVVATNQCFGGMITRTEGSNRNQHF